MPVLSHSTILYIILPISNWKNRNKKKHFSLFILPVSCVWLFSRMGEKGGSLFSTDQKTMSSVTEVNLGLVDLCLFLFPLSTHTHILFVLFYSWGQIKLCRRGGYPLPEYRPRKVFVDKWERSADFTQSRKITFAPSFPWTSFLPLLMS